MKSKSVTNRVLILMCILSLIFAGALTPSTATAAKMDKKTKSTEGEKAILGTVTEKVPKPNAEFDASKMGDMSDYDPAHPIIPTGDTIKLALVASFSGPAAIVGQLYWISTLWAVHDINKRGGIFVDGKKKLIELIKADHMSKPDQCKKICERMVLQEKVHVLMGTNGTPNMKVMMEVGNKYKVIVSNFDALSDELMDAIQFNRYTFMSGYGSQAIAHAHAYYYGQIRKKEKKFYIICQDYSYGHSLAEAFKSGLKKYYPEAQIVGEDFHKLFQTDYAPYLTKIKASGAEVIYTADWTPDLDNLIKQARQMGINIPFANRLLDDPIMLSELGVENTKNMIHMSQADYISPQFRTKDQIKYFDTWHDLWQTKWKQSPYNSKKLQYPDGQRNAVQMQTYWLLSVIERAKSTDPEKIIKVWEGDTYRTLNGKILMMRACDHKVIQDLVVNEFVPPEQQKVSFNKPPYYWSKEYSYTGYQNVIPATNILPWMDQNLDRCKGKNNWGE